MSILNFLERHGVEVSVFRNNECIAKVTGLYNREKATSKKYIGFEPGTDIKIGDCIINDVGDKSYVIDVQTDYFGGEAYQLKAYYQTEAEHQIQDVSQSVIFNINNANGSVIGNNNVLNIDYNANLRELRKTISGSNPEDKEELDKIVSLLELIVEDNVPIKKGILSKFTDLLAKHSWLSTQVAAVLLNWLTSQPK